MADAEEQFAYAGQPGTEKVNAREPVPRTSVVEEPSHHMGGAGSSCVSTSRDGFPELSLTASASHGCSSTASFHRPIGAR